MTRRLLNSGSDQQIAHAIEKFHPSDLAYLFSELSANETQRLIRSLVLLKKAGETISELPEFMIPDLLEAIASKELGLVISRLEADDALFLMEKLPESRWNEILNFIPENKRGRLDQLLAYPKDSAGSMMNPNPLTITKDMTVGEAIQAVRKQPQAEGAFYLYVVDQGQQLVGVQSLRELVLNKEDQKIEDVMNQKVIAINANNPKEEVSSLVSQYNLLAIPVVNQNNQLLGLITVDDVIDVVREEATEDIYHLAGLSEVDRAKTSVWVKVKKRLPWAGLNLITAALAASIIDLFEATIQEMVALAVFMNIIANLGGNGAIQSLTVITRSISLGEFFFIKPKKAILREGLNGFFIGLIAGISMGLIALVWKNNLILSITIAIAMTLTMTIGGLFGSLIPILFRKIKLDPAIGTSVIVTMLTDMVAFFFFLGLASVLFKNFGG